MEPGARSESSSERTMEPGERMLLPCRGGPAISRAERYPPRLEIAVEGGTYVLVDDGPPELWSYDFVPADGAEPR